MGHETGDNRIVAIRNGGFKRTATQEHDGCDHTSTNAPDPIRTSQLSVLGESSTRMGDLLGSPRVAPLFLALFGRYGYYSDLPLVVPMVRPFPSPSAPGDRRYEHPIARYGPSKSRV